MNLPLAKTAADTEATPLISTYSILLLSGMLFGICISGSVNSEIKSWVIASGVLGLAAYLLMSLSAYKHKKTQLRLATIQVEERLDRHSHLDLRVDSARVEQSKTASKRV